jgi:hypothetical protein
MKMLVYALALIAASVATEASAQGVNLTGQYRCVQGCAGSEGQPAFVAQTGWNLNLQNDAGELSRAWVDWAGHIWAERWNEGAVYSPDGMMIQFDRGTVWQRDLGVSESPTANHRKYQSRVKQSAGAVSVAGPVPSIYDGGWSVVIATQSGSCDREYRFGMQISNGDVFYDGQGRANLQGRVSRNGNVWVSVSGQGQRANGQGRLSRNAGTGTWRGEGSGGACAGIWQAVRRVLRRMI